MTKDPLFVNKTTLCRPEPWLYVTGHARLIIPLSNLSFSIGNFHLLDNIMLWVFVSHTSTLHMKQHIALRLKSDLFQAKKKNLPKKKSQQNECHLANYLGEKTSEFPPNGTTPKKQLLPHLGFPSSYWAKGLSQLSSQPPAVLPTAQKVDTVCFRNCNCRKLWVKSLGIKGYNFNPYKLYKFIDHWTGTGMHKQNNPVFLHLLKSLIDFK